MEWAVFINQLKSQPVNRITASLITKLILSLSVKIFSSRQYTTNNCKWNINIEQLQFKILLSFSSCTSLNFISGKYNPSLNLTAYIIFMWKRNDSFVFICFQTTFITFYHQSFNNHWAFIIVPDLSKLGRYGYKKETCYTKNYIMTLMIRYIKRLLCK